MALVKFSSDLTSGLPSVLTSGGFVSASSSSLRGGTPANARKHAHRVGLHSTVAFTSPRIASPGVRTPVIATSVASTVTINDDEAERRQRRLETQMRTMMSPGCHTPKSVAKRLNPSKPRNVESGSNSLSDAQITEHYTNCIRLSSENRINAKNAFGLYLIDYMLEMLTKRGEMTNFQVAGCTLDASAKIYAGRVDSIYNDAYKMLGGLGRGESQENDADTVDGGTGDREGVPSRKRSKRSSIPVSQTIENPKALDINTFDLEFEVDPLFKKTSAAFDEGGIEGLLLNQLCVRDDCCGVLLDASEAPPSDDLSIHEANVSTYSPEDINLQSLQSLEICSTFASFKFTGTAEDSEDPWNIEHLLSEKGIVSPPKNEYRPTEVDDYSMLQCPPVAIAEDDDETYCVGGDFVGFAEEYEAPSEEGGGIGDEVAARDATVLGVCGDPEIAKVIPSHGKEGNKRVAVISGVGDLCLMEAVEPSEYSYFNSAVVSAWAGPQHWKLKLQKVELKKDIVQKVKRKTQPKKQFRMDFSNIPDEGLFAKSKAATRLTKATLSKLDITLTTLPQDVHVGVDVLFTLFTRPKWKIKRQKRVQDMEEGHLDGGWYDYENPNDNENYCPSVVNEGVGGEEDDDDVSHYFSGCGFSQPLNETTPEFYNQSQGLFDIQMPENEDAAPVQSLVLAGDNLVAQPRKVQQIHIDYVKAAKKLDVKKLKAKMWEIIDDDESGDKENLCENIPLGSEGMLKKATKFSDLYTELPSRVSSTTAKNLSVPICVVCLLHLANEKDLKITGSSDMTDLVIETVN